MHAAGPESEVRSRILFKSLKRLTGLDARLLVFPGHTSEPVSFDGELLAAPLGQVASALDDWLYTEEAFVNRILARIPPTPPNYLVISQANESGAWPVSDPTDLEAGANRCAVN